MRFPWKIEVGSNQPPDVRGERVSLPNVDRPFRVLYMSDLHLRAQKTERLCDQLQRIVATTNPELLLLGGDLVDKQDGLPQLTELVSSACRKCLVGAIGGNHDRRVGIGMVEHSVELAGGVWLDRRPLTFVAGTTRVVASGGRRPKGAALGRLHPMRALPKLIRAERHVPARPGLCGPPSRLPDDGVCLARALLSGCLVLSLEWSAIYTAQFRDARQPRAARQRAGAGELPARSHPLPL